MAQAHYGSVSSQVASLEDVHSATYAPQPRYRPHVIGPGAEGTNLGLGGSECLADPPILPFRGQDSARFSCGFGNRSCRGFSV